MPDKPSYKDRIRPRVCGLLVQDAAILLAQIHSPVTDRLIWMPPGGELEFGESVEEGLKREFREETGIEIAVQSFQFINELIEPPFHALELYYRVTKKGGRQKLGSDPEHEGREPLLKELRWIPIRDLNTYEVVPGQLLKCLKAFM